jgi:hypothetical protein
LKFFRVVKTALSRERTGRTLLRGWVAFRSVVRNHGFCGKTADPACDAKADVAAARTIATAGIEDSPWGEQAWIMLRVFPPIRELTGAFRLPPLKNLFLPGMEEGSGCSSAAIALGEERRRFSQDVALYCHSRQFRARTADLRLLLAQLPLAPGASQLAFTIYRSHGIFVKSFTILGKNQIASDTFEDADSEGVLDIIELLRTLRRRAQVPLLRHPRCVFRRPS